MDKCHLHQTTSAHSGCVSHKLMFIGKCSIANQGFVLICLWYFSICTVIDRERGWLVLAFHYQTGTAVILSWVLMQVECSISHILLSNKVETKLYILTLQGDKTPFEIMTIKILFQKSFDSFVIFFISFFFKFGRCLGQ